MKLCVDGNQTLSFPVQLVKCLARETIIAIARVQVKKIYITGVVVSEFGSTDRGLMNVINFIFNYYNYT